MSKVCLTAIWSGGCHHYDLKMRTGRPVAHVFACLVGDFVSCKDAVSETGKRQR